MKLKNLLLQNHWAHFNQTWHKASLGEGDSSLFKWKVQPFSKGIINEIAKIHWLIWKIIFSRTTVPISTKLDTKHPWVKGIQVCSNERFRPLSKGIINEIAKIHWLIWKIFFSRTTVPISTKLDTKLDIFRNSQNTLTFCAIFFSISKYKNKTEFFDYLNQLHPLVVNDPSFFDLFGVKPWKPYSFYVLWLSHRTVTFICGCRFENHLSSILVCSDFSWEWLRIVLLLQK